MRKLTREWNRDIALGKLYKMAARVETLDSGISRYSAKLWDAALPEPASWDLAGIKEKEAIEHLSHIARTLAVQGKKLAIRPAECLLCGYVFEKRQRFTRPSRCPRCKKSHLQSPIFYISHRV